MLKVHIYFEIIVTKKIIKEYLSIILNSKLIQDQIKSYLGITSQPKLALFRIEKLEFPLPSLPEQQKIANILSNVDNLIESTVQVITHSKKVKTGLMQKLLTRGIGHTKFKKVKTLFQKTFIIPESWNLISLYDTTEKKSDSVVDGPFGSNLKTSDYDPLGKI